MFPNLEFVKRPDEAAQAQAAMRWAVCCAQCEDPVPCTAACPQRADIPAVMRWLGQSGCAGFSPERWRAVCEQVAEQEAAAAIAAVYND